MGDATDDMLPLEWKPSTRAVVSCGVCHPPEDVGQNHPHLPNLRGIIAQAEERKGKKS